MGERTRPMRQARPPGKRQGRESNPQRATQQADHAGRCRRRKEALGAHGVRSRCSIDIQAGESMSELITTRVSLWCACIKCGIGVYGPASYESKRRRDHETFYCLNGHSQYFTAKSDIERERQRRELAERERDNTRRFLRTEENSHRATRGHLTRVKKRIAKDRHA